jgi:hypothetical protein
MNTSLIRKLFPYIIIAALALIIVVQRTCNNPVTPVKPNTQITIDGKKYDVKKDVVDTQWVPAKPQIVYKPGATIYVDSPIYVPVPLNTDTAEILKDYFAKRTSKDTLHLEDSLGYVSVLDTIQKNRIFSRTWNSHVNKVLIHDTKYITPEPVTQWYIGGLIGAHKPNLAMAGASLIIKNKKDQLYGINAGYTSNLDLFVQGTVLWKIRLKRK